MNSISKIVAYLLSAVLLVSCGPDVTFSAYTLPAIEGVTAEVAPLREGNEWSVDVRVRNTTDKEVKIKVALAAEPHFKADSYLFPGINYNGNDFGNELDLPGSWDNKKQKMNFPQGLEYEGEPWVFSYDRGSIPSCTISESEERVFALFASDKDAMSYVSSCSMESLEDGSIRHLIYWPVTEAPLCYSDKQKFSERIDNYITLAPGEEFVATANAFVGRPKIKGYGFAEVFPMAWRKIDHTVPAQWSVEEVLALDKSFWDWCRRQDEHGYWFETILDDMKFRAGYYGTGLSEEGLSVADYEQHPEKNRWNKYNPEDVKRLKKGEYLKGAGRELGFAGQSFQMARLYIEYGLRNKSQEEIDFGLKVLHSWLNTRRYESGIFMSNRDRGHHKRDASNMGWSIGELSRVAVLLEKNGMDGTAFKEAVKTIVEIVLKGVREDGAVGSVWDGKTGEVVSYNGDGAGFVLMGLARYHAMSNDERVLPLIERAFDYYYTRDINNFRCFGGAMYFGHLDKQIGKHCAT